MDVLWVMVFGFDTVAVLLDPPCTFESVVDNRDFSGEGFNSDVVDGGSISNLIGSEIVSSTISSLSP